jgi:hypothetical protein
LGEFQWIDFRDTVGANHAAVAKPPDISPAPAPGPPPARPPLRSGRWLSFAALVGVFALAGILSVHVGRQAPDVPEPVTLPKVDPATKPPVEPKKPPPGQHNTTTDLGVPLALTALLVVLAGLGWRWQRTRRHTAATPPDVSSQIPDAVELSIASKLEAEILRRGALRRDAAP